MRKLLAAACLLSAVLAAGQTGPHRKVFSGGSGFNCSNFVTSGINEAQTNGSIFFSQLPVVTFTHAFASGDPILAVANFSQGNAVTNPTLTDAQGLTWIPLSIQPNAAVWYAISGAVSGDVLTVDFHGFFEFAVNWSLTAVHLNRSVMPSIIGPPGAAGTYPTTPSFTLNSSTVSFGATSGAGLNWFFGGIASPSTATFLHGLVVGGITSTDGTSYGSTTPANWTFIIISSLPNTAIMYACS